MRSTRKYQAEDGSRCHQALATSSQRKKDGLGARSCGEENGDKNRLWVDGHWTHFSRLCKSEHTRWMRRIHECARRVCCHWFCKGVILLRARSRTRVWTERYSASTVGMSQNIPTHVHFLVWERHESRQTHHSQFSQTTQEQAFAPDKF